MADKYQDFKDQLPDFVKDEKDFKLFVIRHTAEHIFNQAVEELWPGEIKRAIGPAISTGFYNDSRWENNPSEDDFAKIEERMKEIIKADLPLIRKDVTEEEAREMFKNNPFKQELLDEFVADKGQLSVYYTGDPEKNEDVFVDLCKGPHVESTGRVKSFKLLSIAGAYWRGDEKNEMLTRVYGTAFHDKKALKQYLWQLEEAKKRDHRKIGKDQELYFIDEKVGKGLVMWMPRGTVMREQIESLAKEKEDLYGYQRVVSPHIAKEELYLTSGHLPYYEEDMYPAMEMDDGKYYLKAMNCPHHHQMYLHRPRTYKELPLRFSEYGTCYRNELSGTLAGLLRVRCLAMNDAHTYVSKDQIKDEFKKVLQLTQEYFAIFGLEDYWFRLSKWDPKRTDKYIDEPENWEMTEQYIREVLQEMKVKYIEAEDEAAFYGPKVDVQFKSVIGREETMSTIQLDFLAKQRFGLEYIDKEGAKNNEVFVIHRAPLSVHERFLAFVIEHFAGRFPAWLSPEQVRIVPIGEGHIEYANALLEQLRKNGIRAEVDTASERMQNKIRKAQEMQVPYMAVIGDKEIEADSVALRYRDGGKTQVMKIEEFIEKLTENVNSRSLDTSL